MGPYIHIHIHKVHLNSNQSQRSITFKNLSHSSLSSLQSPQFSKTCLKNPIFLLSMAASSLCYPSNDPKTPNKPSNNPISASKVRVIVRVRPFLPHESTSSSNRVSCISLLDQDSQSQDEVAVYLKDPYTRFQKVHFPFFFFVKLRLADFRILIFMIFLVCFLV